MHLLSYKKTSQSRLYLHTPTQKTGQRHKSEVLRCLFALITWPHFNIIGYETTGFRRPAHLLQLGESQRVAVLGPELHEPHV